jgi:hypothetical protein
LIENKENWATAFFSQCYESKVLAEFVNLINTAISTLDKFEEAHYMQAEEVLAEPEPVPETVDGKPVPPPKPKKKLDNSIDVTSLLPPTSSVSISVSVQAIEFLLRSSNRILLRHNNLSCYWKVFDEAAFVSSELRGVMVSRGHLRALMHLYLHEDSPAYVSEKAHAATSSSKKAHTAFLAASGNLLSAIATLACEFAFPRTANDAMDSPFGGSGDLLPEPDQDFLLKRVTLSRFIGDQANVSAVSRLCCHLSWENEDVSKVVIELLTEGTLPPPPSRPLLCLSPALPSCLEE